MKKYYSLVLFVLVAISAKAQIITISDPAFKAKLLSANTFNGVAKNALGNNIVIDANSNNEIEVSEALTVYNLSVRTPILTTTNDIFNLNGIQFFTNLKVLDCVGNQISGLDLTALTQLEELMANDNELSTLNISGLTSLRKINCSRNNLISFSTDNFANLTELFINDNQISSLSFNNNPNLQYLKCGYNALPSLNVSNLPALRILACEVNQLTSLTMTGLTQMRELVCSANNLTSLNLSGFSNLTFLSCGSNQISAIDLSPLSAITSIDCGYNPFTTLNVAGLTTLFHLGVEGTPITTLDCSQSGVQQLNCINNPNLTYINIRNNLNFLADPDLLYFAFEFNNLPALLSICLDPGEQSHLLRTNYNGNGNVTVYTGPTCTTVVDMSTAGVNDFNKDNAVTLYPNPVQDRINLKFENLSQIKSIAVYNQLGQLVKSLSEPDNDGEISLNVDQLQAGSYLLSVESEKGKHVKKFIKL